MTGSLAGFKATLDAVQPPSGLTPALEALWWDAKENWDKAHDRAMTVEGPDGALVHAYLHRKEGDPDNAAYWYGRAGRTPFAGSLDAEWQAIVADLLAR